ncbi:gamma-glutamyl-gamma-aminobutyrate hydrolase [Heyndrickxia shackletonii]|uniref:Gamma-glutamyl-gamma-aminobutyrate hydrolase n=1 Tax=Heyndrickxia shackletonii TaxID=157838 RepID=A0A0Q3TMB2_9BACI|nr:gamma-glutamyl-gamma-aminobutyrate hydrolase family protein [Heyndrickxia shackletonii]KQL55112.1 gamma-glutamyl-gamma-aminobutyrate hydrolase [Heyndrickxia shackletonii]MBB2482396.1 gamma-glutamyl-gamma-aminobutyrate hydrolase family protein [Bacillus sp. APMAM]NEY98827.1 gamma-glutamyl-gamma-aminobutyrate hydrolase family protein [Heyndrickxia shackletonii]RTZ54250.1 gamma-glutamyl-gamma-aminobutyrate hydrolase family protein [Bacillus sp. SAJ1]
MKPLIGITAHVELDSKHTLANDYIQAVIKAGGIPVLLPIGIDADVRQLASRLDGLVLSGGGDIDPTLFGEEPHPNLGTISPGRDSLEIALIQEMLDRDKPILAICRGIQILNIAAGGDMFQDIYNQIDTPLLQHSQKASRSHLSHYVKAEPNSLLANIAGQSEFKVNSFHHQAVRNVIHPLVITALASDGVIEAIESVHHSFVVGVQWHPEPLALNGDHISMQLFIKFVEACKQ